MSDNNNPSREVAQRTLATEFNNSKFTFKESGEDKAPNYQLLATGGLANRVVVVGTLTEKENVGSDKDVWRGNIVDPTGNFYVYAGEYSPGPASTLREADTPNYVSVVGKPNTFETDDGEVLISIRPEYISVVDEETRDQWVLEAAEHTLERLDQFEDSEFNVTEEDLESGTGDRNMSVPVQYGLDTQDEILEDVVEALESMEE